MPDRGVASTSSFAASFPARFGAVLDEARGAMEGIAASARDGNGLIPPEALTSLHEIYQLRIEIEMETAGVLWRTAEVVCALADAMEVLENRARPVPLPPAGWLTGLARNVLDRRRTGFALQNGEQELRAARRPDLRAPDAGLREAA